MRQAEQGWPCRWAPKDGLDGRYRDGGQTPKGDPELRQEEGL